MGNKLGHTSDVGTAEDKGKVGHTANGEDSDEPVASDVHHHPIHQPISLIPVASSTSTNNLDQKVSKKQLTHFRHSSLMKKLLFFKLPFPPCEIFSHISINLSAKSLAQQS